MSIVICDKFELGYLLSQGKAGTQLRCGGKYCIGFVGNLILFRMMKKLGKSVKIWQSYGRAFSGFFWRTLYEALSLRATVVLYYRVSFEFHCYLY